jgi:hypothetical protein
VRKWIKKGGGEYWIIKVQRGGGGKDYLEAD